MVAESANPMTVGAVTALGVLFGLSIMVIFAMMMRRHLDSRRTSAMAADQEWHGPAGTGVFAVHIP